MATPGRIGIEFRFGGKDRRERARMQGVWRIPRREQLRLEAKYHFAAAKWTGVTAGFLLACALLQIWASILVRATIVALVGPVYLVCESLYRLYVSKFHGLPAASLAGFCLGLLLRPPP